LTNWPLGHEIRADLWQEICRCGNPNFNAHKGSYDPDEYSWKGLDGQFMPKVPFAQGPDVLENNYELNADGVAALHRLIRALGKNCPTLIYAPFLPSILALFLHYMSEEETYACGRWIVKNLSTYMPHTPVALKA
uniref:Alpha-carbonic anhydrase domain-containing protein n=1 Tax=Gongylonema pulchrum TaxID=637853 RepID=A0A183EQP6_9BILA